MVTGRSTASISDSCGTLLRTLVRITIRFRPAVWSSFSLDKGRNREEGELLKMGGC